MKLRVGLGMDFHRFAPKRKLILAGVKFDYSRGLLGHSDADVIAHAVADAVLGAAKLGDIGQHFPDKDPAYKDADSLVLLKKCCAMTRKKGFEIGNIDVMVVLEEPKLAPRLAQMEKNLSQAMGLKADEVSVKATRPEQMGALGRKEGIAAFAVCLIEKKRRD
jgi:2-C-methyl-D-erythritol 2,4-cyclodiphosphate synthase